MPALVINTNVPTSAVPDEFMTDVSSLVARLVGKPESFVCIQVNADQKMTFGGSKDLCALCSFDCIGKISSEENKIYTAAFMELINRKLKIDVNRIYIKFSDVKRENYGWNGTTFG